MAFNAALLAVAAGAMRLWNDEWANLAQARYLASHGLRDWSANYAMVNRWLGLHHPPLLPLIYSGLYRAIGFNLAVGRFFSVACSLGAMAAAYRLARRAVDEPTAALATLTWSFAPLWFYNGGAAILEGPLLLVMVLTADALLAFAREPKASRGAIAGAWLTAAVLCRYNGALLIPGFAALMLMRERRAAWRHPGVWLALGIPLVVLAALGGFAATTGLAAAQAERMRRLLVMLNPGGPTYLMNQVLPLWPLHIGAQAFAPAALALAALAWGQGKNRELLALGGGYLLLILLILPNPRYLLPALPFLAVGVARVLQAIERRGGGATTAWLGIAAASIILAAVTIGGAYYDNVYPFY
jgi:4-amino-4-deoxy-L-arabinose transferase-like glycosyltransferase